MTRAVELWARAVEALRPPKIEALSVWPEANVHLPLGLSAEGGPLHLFLPRRKIVLRIGFASLAVAALFALCLPADAHISCNGNFQITKYGPIATPYCEEEQIAIVAQSYGWNVSTSQIHNDPLKKVYVCQILGSDVRLKGSCAGYGPNSFRP